MNLKKFMSDLKPLFDLIVVLQDRGILYNIRQKWWVKMGGGLCGVDRPQVSSASELNIENVGGVFVVLVAGVGLGCVFAALEFIWKSMKLARHERENRRKDKRRTNHMNHMNGFIKFEEIHVRLETSENRRKDKRRTNHMNHMNGFIKFEEIHVRLETSESICKLIWLEIVRIFTGGGSTRPVPNSNNTKSSIDSDSVRELESMAEVNNKLMFSK
ncbi:unnamed protein product [Medioppia subpectinata]|uniref:Uncharacterized protein n=1 Tax=Medioppia subpectinata TaxID=1979941 RepID=A0A7R9PVG8_9ACAR|nr:unnamed protein product [Medioppia subpectinata]CAG2102629.1 unnamed protein product [Medioppia subpectinata]